MLVLAFFKMLRTKNTAQKLDFWSLVKFEIWSGPALRAIFKILARNVFNL